MRDLRNRFKYEYDFGTELIVNGGFNTDLSGWTPTVNVVWWDDPPSPLFTVPAQTLDSITQAFSIHSGYTYQVSFDLQGVFPNEISDSNEQRVSILLGGTVQYIEDSINNGVRTFEMVVGDSNLNIVLQLNNIIVGITTIYFDNVSVKEKIPGLLSWRALR